jgi:DNA uptake protein ComE-like DNA-binding protein
MKQKVTPLFIVLFSVLLTSVPTAPAYALPPTDIGGIMVYHFKPSGGVSGLDGVINLDQKTDLQDAERCEHSSAIVKIHTVVYEGVSEIVAGFRTDDDTLYRVSIEALYKNLANSQRGLLKDLFKRNQNVLTSYSVCGSGGFIFINEIYKVSAIKGLDIQMLRQKADSSSKDKINNVNINAADEKTLTMLRGISVAMAKEIIKSRPYSSIGDLIKKKVISDKAYFDIRDQIVAISPQFSAGGTEPTRYPPSGGSLVRKDLGR